VLLSTLRKEDLGDASTNGAGPPVVATPARPAKELPPEG